MGKFFSAAASAALLCTSVLATSSTVAAPNPSPQAIGAVAFCADVVLPNVPEANLGECVSYSIIPGYAFSTHDCDAWLEIYPDSFYSVFDSYSECVRELRNSY